MQVLQNISPHFPVFLHCTQGTDNQTVAQKQLPLPLSPFFHSPVIKVMK